MDYNEAIETYSRIGPQRSYGNLQSYWTTTKLWKLTVVLDYCEAMETYSRIHHIMHYSFRDPHNQGTHTAKQGDDH